MITIKQLEKALVADNPNGVHLSTFDYRECIEDKGMLEELATTGYIESFWETQDGWIDDMEYESMDWYLEEAIGKEKKDYVNNVVELYDFQRDWFRDHDKSDPLKELLKNSGRQYWFYDLNFECTEDDYTFQAYEIAKFLKIDFDSHKEKLFELTQNAFCGGMLTILFSDVPDRLLKGDEERKFISFSTYQLCIMDRTQGSGWSVDMNTPITLKFHQGNLHHDDGCTGYSFSGDVCGMSGREADYWTFLDRSEDYVEVDEDEQLKRYKEEQDKFESTFVHGGCTYGDTKINRHRNTEYINDFPCGHKCKDCGQFWID